MFDLDRSRRALLLLLFATAFVPALTAAGPACPAGMPLGNFRLTVTRAEGSVPLPLNRINRLEEGDKVSYEPVLKPKEKRPGEVTLVLVAANPQAGDPEDFTVLETKSADKPAEWSVPRRAALALYVYGPSGLSTRKLKGFISADRELVSQLADYAEKTAQTESVLQALSNFELTGSNAGIQAALEGFANSGGTSKIDRTASLDQQTLAAMRTLNPALSAYDPISPSARGRVAQTAGLATTVAGMFLGSTVGLAAGGAAMGLNLKTLMFPDTEFRSAYTHELTLCSAREAAGDRKRRAYLWAVRVPNARPPAVTVGEASHIPQGLTTRVPVKAADPDWKLVSRVRDWKLQPTGEGSAVPVQVTAISEGRVLEINPANVPPGKYSLTGFWDWDAYTTVGNVDVERLGSFADAKLTPETANKLQEQSGKQVVVLTNPSADFEFVEKLTIAPEGDKYATPASVPFSLPVGPRRGPQDRLEMQIDTSAMKVGTYQLSVTQQGGSTQTVPLHVVKAPPSIDSLPLVVNCGMQNEPVSITGKDLDRITAIEADNAELRVDRVAPDRLVLLATAKPGAQGPADLRLHIRDYPAPLLLPAGLLLAQNRPVIREAEPSTPTGLPVALRKGELLAGITNNILLRVDGATAASSLTIRCKEGHGSPVTVRAGSSDDKVRLQLSQTGTMFLSLDAGRWQAGCTLVATLDTPEQGRSKPAELGTVVSVPTIEGFKLTEETAGEGKFIGVLTGRDLELIEKTGWEATNGEPVSDIPAAIVGQTNQQSLRIKMSWPSPTPHAPLYIWLRGETEGRATTIRY